MKINANWITCAEYSHSGETEGEHSYKDNCWTCAPFWWNLPICPMNHKERHSEKAFDFMDIQVKLRPSGYCPKCKKFYNVNRQ